MENYDNGFKNGFVMGIFFGSVISAVINTLPFTDRSKYVQAIAECEKTLPRDQHCSKVIGVLDENLNSTKRIN